MVRDDSLCSGFIDTPDEILSPNAKPGSDDSVRTEHAREFTESGLARKAWRDRLQERGELLECFLEGEEVCVCGYRDRRSG